MAQTRLAAGDIGWLEREALVVVFAANGNVRRHDRLGNRPIAAVWAGDGLYGGLLIESLAGFEPAFEFVAEAASQLILDHLNALSIFLLNTKATLTFPTSVPQSNAEEKLSFKCKGPVVSQ